MQHVFQKYFSLENTLIFFSNSSSKPLESTKKSILCFFKLKMLLKHTQMQLQTQKLVDNKCCWRLW